MTPIDEACRVLAEMAAQLGVHGINLLVRRDEGVVISAVDRNGTARGMVLAGADGTPQLPSEALAKWRGGG